jgi:hypothetical protein
MSKSLSSRQALALAALLAMSTSASAAEYSIEPIQHPSGHFVFASSVANNGLVAGHVYAYGTCFKYLDGVFTTLALPPNTRSCEYAVTDPVGNITMKVVPADKPTTTRLVELTTNGTFRFITGLGGDSDIVVASRAGRMAGSSQSASGEPQAYLFSRKGAGVNVGALTGMTRSWLTGLNTKGWAVGMAQKEGSNRGYAFRYNYNDGKIFWLKSLTRDGSTSASGINSSGTIVGSAETVPDDYMSNRAVTWQGKSAPVNQGSDFELFALGQAINSSGLVVGRIGDSGMRSRNGVVTELHSLIPPDQQIQWGTLGDATAINDDGLIVGTLSAYKGSIVAYLLRPLP